MNDIEQLCSQLESCVVYTDEEEYDILTDHITMITGVIDSNPSNYKMLELIKSEFVLICRYKVKFVDDIMTGSNNIGFNYLQEIKELTNRSMTIHYNLMEHIQFSSSDDLRQTIMLFYNTLITIKKSVDEFYNACNVDEQDEYDDYNDDDLSGYKGYTSGY
jgi:hypothetical protein